MSENTKSRAGSKRDTSVESNKTEQIDLLRQALAWFFNDRMFAKIRTHGNTKWSARSLVTLAILMAWSEASQLTEAFKKAASLSNRLYGMLAVATYQGLMRHVGHLQSTAASCDVESSPMLDGTLRCGAFSDWYLVAAGGRWFAVYNSAHSKQRKGFLGQELRERQKSQVSQEMEK